jgi:hypothetical protein
MFIENGVKENSKQERIPKNKQRATNSNQQQKQLKLEIKSWNLHFGFCLDFIFWNLEFI